MLCRGLYVWNIDFSFDSQLRDWSGEAWGAERGGSADPADPGAREVAAGDDGAEIQAVHGRRRGGDALRPTTWNICSRRLR